MTINLGAALYGDGNADLELEHLLSTGEVSDDQIIDSLDKIIGHVVSDIETYAENNALECIADTLITNSAFDDYYIYSESVKRAIIEKSDLVNTIADNRDCWSVDSEVSQFYNIHDDLIYSYTIARAIVGCVDVNRKRLYDAISGHNSIDIDVHGEMTLSNPVNVYVTYCNLYNLIADACENYSN